MATINVEINNKSRKDGQNLLFLRITQNRLHKRISLNRYLPLRHFNKAAKFGFWIRTSYAQHKEINELIKSKILDVQSRETDFNKKGVKPNLIQLANDNVLNQIPDFIEFAKREINRHRAHNQFRTAVKKGHLINKLILFTGYQNIQFDTITVPLLRDYENFWILRGNKLNTIQTDFKGMRSIIKSAILEGIITSAQNPFDRYRIKSEKTFRDKLDIIEIKTLTDLILKPGSIEWHARNMFIFSYYCAGIRFGDLLQLKWSNVQGDHLSYVMDKTGEPFAVLLTKEAYMILSQYNSAKSNPDEYIFPFFKSKVNYSDQEFLTKQISSKNAIVNKSLKKVMSQAGISKKVSFHISRHSFAYMALRKTGDVYSVSKSLNHKKLDTTEVYLKQFDVNASDSLLRKVFNE